MYLFYKWSEFIELFFIIISGDKINNLSKHCFFTVAKIIPAVRDNVSIVGILKRKTMEKYDDLY